MDEIQQLEQAIRALEAQRSVLGDAVVEAALAPMREKLASLRQKPGVEERRLVTALFSDLVGFTAMSEHMDPEDVREVMNRYLSRWQVSIEAHGGAVEKFIGDAVMAVFGLINTREDDPQRAIECALEMLDELEHLNNELEPEYGLHLAVRVGVHTGPVVVSTLGERKGHEFVAVGDTVNLASRLQSAAPVNGILISHDTYRHVQGIFDTRALEPIIVKGKAQPVRVHQVCGLRAASQRVSGRGIAGVNTPLVGRQAEMEKLQAFYEQVVSSPEAWVVTVTGDPGVGKTRLLTEFEAWRDARQAENGSVLNAAAYPYMTEMPYSLLRSAFGQRCGILESDTLQETQRKLETGLQNGFEQDGAMKAHFIGALLGFDFSGSPYLQGVRDDPRQLRKRALFYLEQWLSGQAQQGPVLLAMDDIQWADAASLEALQVLAERCARLPVLVICLARQRIREAHPDWERRQEKAMYQSAWLALKPLSEEDSTRFLDEILKGDGKTLPDAEIMKRLQSLVVDAAGGNPYFLEEMLKMLIEEGAVRRKGVDWEVDGDRLHSIQAPPTLTALLQARLDSLLPNERRTLQRAAVIGRVFWEQLLEALQTDERNLSECLANLLRREMIYLHEPSAFEDSREFVFQHMLLKDVAYDTLLRKHRQAIHAHIAGWLAVNAREHGRSAEFAPLVAQNYDRAGEALEAARWWLLSGQYARQRGALAEGRRNLDRALELLPAGEAGLRWEALLERDGLLAEIGDLQSRQADDAELLRMAEAGGDDQKLAVAYQRMATTYGYHGEDQQALLALESAEQHAGRCGDLKVQVGVSSFKVATLTRMGRFQQAGLQVERALTLARQLGDERELAIALVNASLYHARVGDQAESAKLILEAIELSRKSGNLIGEAIGLNNLGYSYVVMGMYALGVEVLHRSARIAESIGARRDAAYALLNLALAHAKINEVGLAYQELETGTRSLVEQGDAFGQATGVLYLGLALEAASEHERASQEYAAAVELFEAIHIEGSAMDGRAGLARSLLTLGDLSGARAQAYLVWRHLNVPAEQALEFPFDAYLACMDVFTACGEAAIALEALETGHGELLRFAALISDPEWRQSFLENVPAHRRLRERYHETGGNRVE